MKKVLSILVLGLASGSLIACGGLDEEDAAKGWSATNMALVSAQAAGAPQTAQRQAGETKNHACSGGGSLDLTTDSTTESASLSANFNDCNSGGIVISGPLSWSVATSMTEVKFDYTGTLDWSGDVEGECEVALHYATTTAGAVSYSGSLCGYETSELSL